MASWDRYMASPNQILDDVRSKGRVQAVYGLTETGLVSGSLYLAMYLVPWIPGTSLLPGVQVPYI